MTIAAERSRGILGPTLVSGQIYEYLENEILTGRLPGGTRLRVRQLAELVGTSVMPVRDAISRLEEAGLAERLANRGAIVKEFSVPELIEIYAMRALLEVEAARLGAVAINEAGLSEMQVALEVMDQALGKGRIGEAMAASSQTLRILYQASAMKLLCSSIESLWKRSHYYRIIGATTAYGNDDDSIWAPSRQILAAARQHDPDRAAQITRDSLASATKRLKARQAPERETP